MRYGSSAVPAGNDNHTAGIALNKERPIVRRVAKLAFVFLTLSCVLSAPALGNGMPVPDAECPCNPGKIIHDPACQYVFQCRRLDSAPYLLSPGEKTEPLGERLGCDTCCQNCDCANPPAGTHVCTATLSITLTRTFTFTMDAGIQVGIPVIQASLRNSFSHAAAVSYAWSVTGGASAMPSCEKREYAASVSVMKDTVYAMDHQYQWFIDLVSGPQFCGGDAKHNFCPPRVSQCRSDNWGSGFVKFVSAQACP